MNFITKLFDNKKSLNLLLNSFPEKLNNDVKLVFNECSKKFGEKHFINGVYKLNTRQLILLNNESITIPYRVNFLDNINDKTFHNFSFNQKIIYHCIYSLSYDGLVREKHLKQLLNYHNIPHWVFPFILKNGSEYVIEILVTIYNELKGKNTEQLKQFCYNNLQQFLHYNSEMINYWNELYRNICYRYKYYIGRKLFFECFGYKREYEKFRKSFKNHSR